VDDLEVQVLAILGKQVERAAIGAGDGFGGEQYFVEKYREIALIGK